MRMNDIPAGAHVLCAVSGGADSTALLHMMKMKETEYGIQVYAAHFNHCLRGSESDSDEAFVVCLCEELAVPLKTGRGDVAAFALSHGMSTEEAAREMRYSFLLSAAEEFNCGVIATAHNSDDNIETVILNLARGTGLKGLCGIPPVRQMNGVLIVRPILDMSREQIEEYLKENGLSHVEDSSNSSDDYSRNVIRHNIVPVLKSINGGLNTAVLRSTELLREDEEYLDRQAKDFISSSFDGSSLPLKPLRKLPRPVSSRVIRSLCPKSLGRTHVDAVLKLIEVGGKGFADLPGIRLTKENGRLYFGIDEKFTSR